MRIFPIIILLSAIVLVARPYYLHPVNEDVDHVHNYKVLVVKKSLEKIEEILSEVEFYNKKKLKEELEIIKNIMTYPRFED